jgi:hypothetical protein
MVASEAEATQFRVQLEYRLGARGMTMPVLRLILDPEGAAFEIDDAMLTGTCATQIAAQLGYPTADSSGMPDIYQLHLTNRGSFLPNDRRFRGRRFTAGTHTDPYSYLDSTSCHIGSSCEIPDHLSS